MKRQAVTLRGSVVLAVGLATFALLVAGCGGSKSPSIASIETTTTSSSAASSTSATSGGAGSGVGPSQAQLQQSLLKYARCMRSNGVPNFPDPSPSGGFQLSAGIDPSSPLFTTAQAKCQKRTPGGGFPTPGSTTHPSAQALAQMVEVAQCMRRHGSSGFPDPTTSIPSKPPVGGGVISDRDGVILVFPATLDMQSPRFVQAAAACGFQLTNH